jgi:choline kinase
MTRAVILAAGEGTRLRPLTERMPKALVTLNGKPLLTRQLEVLHRAGVREVSLVAGHCADAFGASGLPIFLNPRYAETNMVASLRCARSLFKGDDDVLVAYGDIVYEPRVLNAVLNTSAPLGVAVDLGWRDLWRLRMDDPLADAETMKLDPEGYIYELGRKPHSLADIEGQYLGLFKVDRTFAPLFFEHYEQWPQDQPFEGRPIDRIFMTSYLQHQIDHGVKARAATFHHGWLEVDSLQDLRAYEDAQAAGRLAAIYNGEA